MTFKSSKDSVFGLIAGWWEVARPGFLSLVFFALTFGLIGGGIYAAWAIGFYVSKVQANEGGIARLTEDMSDVKEEQIAIRYEIVALREDFRGLRADVDTLRADVDTLRADVDTLRADVSTLAGQMGEVLAIVKRLEKPSSD
ncbi:hypothetical protein [Thioalkalivibrio sp. HK1]|uniref:hypothetical protein n=1 Tax=Thioalkalivibrio sp. HK1 TaxID=1469245 RepID=UPI00046FE658|nr:hypothetical protein [Thioalkalivibrio sp. HK1]